MALVFHSLSDLLNPVALETGKHYKLRLETAPLETAVPQLVLIDVDTDTVVFSSDMSALSEDIGAIRDPDALMGLFFGRGESVGTVEAPLVVQKVRT